MHRLRRYAVPFAISDHQSNFLDAAHTFGLYRLQHRSRT